MVNRLESLRNRLVSRTGNPPDANADQAQQAEIDVQSQNRNERLFYRTADGSMDIEFLFCDCGTEGWRAYILTELDYRGRNASSSTSHRLFDSRLGLHYICWSEKIRTKEQCKTVARLWSDKTMAYIKKGVQIQ